FVPVGRLTLNGEPLVPTEVRNPPIPPTQTSLAPGTKDELTLPLKLPVAGMLAQSALSAVPSWIVAWTMNSLLTKRLGGLPTAIVGQTKATENFVLRSGTVNVSLLPESDIAVKAPVPICTAAVAGVPFVKVRVTFCMGGGGGTTEFPPPQPV